MFKIEALYFQDYNYVGVKKVNTNSNASAIQLFEMIQEITKVRFKRAVVSENAINLGMDRIHANLSSPDQT